MELVKVRCPICKGTWLTNKYSHTQCCAIDDVCGVVYKQLPIEQTKKLKLVGEGNSRGTRTSDIEVKE